MRQNSRVCRARVFVQTLHGGTSCYGVSQCYPPQPS